MIGTVLQVTTSWKKIRRAALQGLLLPIVLSGACVRTSRHTPGEVRAAIGEARIHGMSPEQVIGLLRAVRLAHGDSIDVGDFQLDRLRIESSVSPAGRTLFIRWAIDVTVTFDSAKRATGLEVDYSAINPL